MIYTSFSPANSQSLLYLIYSCLREHLVLLKRHSKDDYMKPELRIECKLKQREADTTIYNGDERRDLACKDLQERFGRRFPGLLLVWDEVKFLLTKLHISTLFFWNKR